MNTTDNAETPHAGPAPKLAPARGPRPKSGDLQACHKAAPNVARVSCPDEGRVRAEAFGTPVSHITQRPNGPLVTGRLSRIVALPWAISNRDSKLLEIAVTYTKQTTEVLSNRDKIAPLTITDLTNISPLNQTKIRAKSDARR
jgi:hypothetical protein